MLCQQNEEIKSKVLNDMYVEMDCRHAVWLRAYLLDQKQHKEDLKVEDDMFDASILDQIDDFVRFTMVIRFNSVELCPPAADGGGPGENFGHALFEKACKMSHSCKPNCVWHTLSDGCSKEIRVIAPIEKGEELTVDYVGSKLDATHERRKELLLGKGFVCGCQRCSRKVDDTRRFKCSGHKITKCEGVHFVSQPTDHHAAVLLNCSHCNAPATAEYTEQQLAEEKAIQAEVTELDKMADNGTLVFAVSERINQLHPPHDFHALAEKCYMLKGECSSQHGDYESAAKFYAKQIHCRIAILGNDYYNETTAFCCERLGDALRHINLYEAEIAYQRTVRTLQMMRGGTADPYTKCAVKKLVDVQVRIQESESEPREPRVETCENVVGLASPPDGPPQCSHPCELCGNESCIHRNGGASLYHYCCQEHLRIHLMSIHGQRCNSSCSFKDSTYEQEAHKTSMSFSTPLTT